MPRWMRAAAAVLACAMLLGAPAARAATIYDPEVSYFTLTTPHFYVMYPAGYDHIALRAGRIAEGIIPRIERRYGWTPDGRIAIVINDQTDFANGSATIVPSKVVTVYVTAPTEVSGLEDYDDWLVAVITHELTHIVHLDMAFGLPWLGRLVFGKYVSMNQYTPAWVTEGVAVYEETASTGSGRGRSSYVDMVVRMAALDDRFPGIDQGYVGFPRWPFSNVAYFIGGRFQLWLSERFGEEQLLRYHRTYATDPIPYFTWLPAMIVFDQSMESLWSEFAEDMRKDAEKTLALLKAQPLPLTEARRLTRYGGDLLGPRITPDGRGIIFSTSSPYDGARVRRIDIDGGKDSVLVDDTFSKAITFTPRGDAFYFQQTEINQRFYTHNSLLRYQLGGGSPARLRIAPGEAKGFVAPSGSLRARDPDVSPDGKRLVFVQTPYGANRMVLATLEPDGLTIHPKEIVAAEPDVQLSDPRFSPDGKLIAASRFRGGRRDVVLFDLDGKVVREVTRDRFQDIDPTFTPDGRWLVFSSDRNGIYNLYAYALERNEIRQLTNLVGGAYQPCVSPDGKQVVYRGYSAEGFDVYAIPFDPEHGLPVPLQLEPRTEIDVTARRWPPRSGELPEIPPPAPFTGTPLPATLPEGWSIRSYSSLDTLLPFHDNWNLYPTVVANEREVFGSLSHFGQDALGTQTYAMALTYGTLTKFVGGGASYFNDQFEPTFGFSGSANAVTYSRTLFTAPPASTPCPFGVIPTTRGQVCYGSPNGNYNQRQLTGAFSIGLPFLQRHLFSIGYAFQRRDALDPLPASTLTQDLPRSGRFASVNLGYSYGNVRVFPYSVSLERGGTFGIGLSALSKGLGSNYEEFVLTTEGRYYLTLPWTARWLKNHVIANRLVLGLSGGPDLAELFQLGGVTGYSAFTTTSANFYGLRGIDTGALSGTGIVAGSVEYRAPILRVDRGLGTLPVTLSVFHASVFLDYGRVFKKVGADAIRHDFFGPFALGVGAELAADVLLIYSIPLAIVGGYAHAVHRPDNVPVDVSANGPYLRLGAIF